VLTALWVLLISFGAVSAFRPGWLQALSDPGAELEASRHKHAADDLLLNQHRPHQAIVQYEKALEIRPNNVGALVNLAISHIQAGGQERGLRILAEALKRDDCRRGVIYFNLGEQLALKGRFAEAEECYRRALASDEVARVLVYRSLGLLYMQMDDVERACEAFEHSLASQTDPVTPYREMLQRSLGPYEEDSVHYRVILEQLHQSPDDSVFARYDLDIVYRMQQLDRDVAKTHNYLGFLNSRLGRMTAAREHYQESLRIWPGNTDAVSNLALLE